MDTIIGMDTIMGMDTILCRTQFYMPAVSVWRHYLTYYLTLRYQVHRSWYLTFEVHNLFLWGGASPTFGRTMVLLFSNNGNSKMLGHPTAGSMDNRGRDAFRENNGMVTKYREQWLYCSRTMEIPKFSNGGWGRPWKPQRITDGVTLTLAYCY